MRSGRLAVGVGGSLILCIDDALQVSNRVPSELNRALVLDKVAPTVDLELQWLTLVTIQVALGLEVIAASYLARLRR